MDYSASVTFTSSNYYEKEVNDSMSSANLINLNTKYTGNIDNGNDYDYYKIIVPSDGEVGVNFTHNEIIGDSNNYWDIQLLDAYNKEYWRDYVQGNFGEFEKTVRLSKGTYYLRVKCYHNYYDYQNDMDYNMSVNVAVKVTSITLNKPSLSILKGNTVILTAAIAPSNASNKGVTWKSSNTAVATVDSTGKVTGIAAGSATITCTAGDGSGKSVTCVVTVTNPVSVTGITLNSTTLSIVKGNATALVATIAPSNAGNKAVTWKSSNIAVATVDSTGKVTGIAAGSATITCTANDGSGKSVTCVVTVTNPITATGITLNSKTLSIVKGNTGNLTATLAPSNASNKAVTWKSSNTAVATVDSTGKVIGIAAGSATITCTAGDGSGKSATCAVTVTK